MARMNERQLKQLKKKQNRATRFASRAAYYNFVTDNGRVDPGSMGPAIERIRRQMLTGEPADEYGVSKRLSEYLQTFHKELEFRFDYAGLSTTRRVKDKKTGQVNEVVSIEAKKHKAISKRRGWPDFELYLWRGNSCGLCLELKKSGENLRMKRDARKPKVIGHKTVKGARVKIRENKIRRAGEYVDLHVEEQGKALEILRINGRMAGFSVGLEATLINVEAYIHANIEVLKRFLQE